MTTAVCYALSRRCISRSTRQPVQLTSMPSPGVSDSKVAGSLHSGQCEGFKAPSELVANSDINFAAALRAQYAIETPKVLKRQQRRLVKQEAEEPLVDETVTLPLHSRKTERLQKRKSKKSQRAIDASSLFSLLELPIEILNEVISYLTVADVFRLSRTDKFLLNHVQAFDRTLARSIINRRYWVLYRCFPLPIALHDVPEIYHAGLLSPRRQELLNIHRHSYHHHIEMVDPHAVCTCMTCVFAWNNLCLLVDLHHWQKNLADMEPIPIIQRGTNPPWNERLLTQNAAVVRAAMNRSLYHAAILEKHYSTITNTIMRFAKWKKKGSSKTAKLYQLTDWDLASGTDAFLERKGPPSYDFPFHRDNYYSLEAYLPNRKFGNDGKWHYYALPPAQHEKDLEWLKSAFQSTVSPEQRRIQALASLKDHNTRWAQYLETAQKT